MKLRVAGCAAIFVLFLCSMSVLMTSSRPKCGGGQVFAVGLEEGEVGCGGAEIGGGAGSGGMSVDHHLGFQLVGKGVELTIRGEAVLSEVVLQF